MATLKIEVVYALPGAEDAVALSLPQTATVRDAIRASRIAERHPEIDLARQKVGVHGSLVQPGSPVHDGDRVEIYRPLTLDPKEARRRRARKKR